MNYKEQINAVIAEWCGWTEISPNQFKVFDAALMGKHPTKGLDALGGWGPIPNYCEDLNSLYEVEEQLMKRELGVWNTYSRNVARIAQGNWGGMAKEGDFSHLSASERCEAILRTLDKWQEDPQIQ